MVSLEFRIWWLIILLKNVGYLVNSFRLTLKTRNMSEAKWRDPPPKNFRPNNSSHVLSNIEISHEILPTKYSKIPIFQYSNMAMGQNYAVACCSHIAGICGCAPKKKASDPMAMLKWQCQNRSKSWFSQRTKAPLSWGMSRIFPRTTGLTPLCACRVQLNAQGARHPAQRGRYHLMWVRQCHKPAPVWWFKHV